MVATCVLLRSTASKYCVRSFVPIEIKSIRFLTQEEETVKTELQALPQFPA